MALNKASILAAKDTKISSPIPAPEWGGEVYCKTLSGTERDAFEQAYSEDRMKQFRPRFLVLTLCDSDGERLFSDADSEELGKKSSVVLNRIFEVAWKHNAFTDEAVEALGEGSPVGQSESSTSASLLPSG
jgi:hypothetical protein